jgi:molybdopterin-guanine dinucleotide biosynthesis protein A
VEGLCQASSFKKRRQSTTGLAVNAEAGVTSASEIGAYVLAGGRSTRFGRDKALAEVGGAPLLERMIGLLRGVTKEARIVAGCGKYEAFGVEIVEDRWPGEGPLGGIITALEDAAGSAERAEWNLILSCDLPFLTREWLMFLCARAAKSEARVVLPCSANGPEPLCACYRTSAAAELRAAFESGVRKVTQGLQSVTTEVLDEAEWKRFDSAGRLFWNMNTQADYEEAGRSFKKGCA